MERYLCKYIHNVSHNSLMCLMIGVTNIKIISLHLKFKTNFSKNSFTDSVVTKVSGNQSLDVNIYYATIEIT